MNRTFPFVSPMIADDRGGDSLAFPHRHATWLGTHHEQAVGMENTKSVRDTSRRVTSREAHRLATRPARSLLPLVLAPVLAIGALVVSPARAYAVPGTSVPLPAGQTAPTTAVAFGSTIVWDTVRSTDGGATFTPATTLAGNYRWDFIGNGKMVRAIDYPTNSIPVVYTPATDSTTTYPGIDTGYDSLNDTYASYKLSVHDLATNTATSLIPPSGATVSGWTHELSSTNALLWKGWLSDNVEDIFAASPTPTSPATPWVTIPNLTDYLVSGDDFLSVQVTTTAVTVCHRSLSAFAAAPTCKVVATGDHTGAYLASIRSMGSFYLVDLQQDNGTPVVTDNAYVLSSSLSTVTPVALPAGNVLLYELLGGSPYVVVQNADTVPVVETVAASGALTPSFTIPKTIAAVPASFLAAAPDRVVGTDPRDGSQSTPVWSRKVTASGFGAETSVPTRADGLAASAGRTVVWGPAGVVVYDRGTAQHTFADPPSVVSDVMVSGPYVVERLVDGTGATSTKVSLADGTPVMQFAGWPVGLFGSQLVSTFIASGSMQVLVRDLTGVAADTTYTLPTGTDQCTGEGVWGSAIALYCPADPGNNTTHVYDYTTGQLLGATSGFPQSLGDGYAVVNNWTNFEVWAYATNTVNATSCLNSVEGTDGVGHVVCQTGTDLQWADYSALSTHAPRELGALAAPTVSFAEPGSSWSLAIDTTKALAGGQVAIYNAAHTLVRSLATTPSADGSVRLTWDGLNDSSKPVPTGAYTYTLAANAADGTGAVTSVSGTGAASGTVTVTGASTAGMAVGGFASLSPSRLLDTRTNGPALGAGQTRTLKVTGVGGVPSTGVSAVVLNVTVTDTTTPGYLTVSPTGTTRPVVSNLNSSAGATIPNAVTVKVGTAGSIDLYQSGPGTAQVIVDVAGYYIDGTVTAAGAFTSLTPARILDTRTTGGPLAYAETRDLQILGQGGVPATNVSAVVLNTTVTDTTATGFLTVFPSGTTRPTASNLNWVPGLTIPNLVTVQVGDNGKVSVFQSGPGTANVVVDVAGYYLGGTATLPGTFVALAPARVLDTRSSSPVAGLSDRTVPILGAGGIPASGVSAVVVNTTVTETTSAGFLTVYPGTEPWPTASNLNWSAANTTIPNLVIVQVGTDGSLKLHNGSGTSTQVVADIAGYYIGG